MTAACALIQTHCDIFFSCAQMMDFKNKNLGHFKVKSCVASWSLRNIIGKHFKKENWAHQLALARNLIKCVIFLGSRLLAFSVKLQKCIFFIEKKLKQPGKPLLPIILIQME